MGVIKKQGFLNTVLSYFGFILGGINTIFLFPNFLVQEVFGLVRLMTDMAGIYAHISTFGLGSMMIRYFPHYRSDEDKRHNGIVFFYLFMVSAGFLVVTLFGLIFRGEIIEAYQENSALLVDYFYWLLPFGLAMMFYKVAEVLGKVVFKTVFPLITREVLMRLAIALGMVGVMMGFMSSMQFFFYYTFSFILIMPVLTFGYILTLRKFSFQPTMESFNRERAQEFMGYSFYAFFSTTSTNMAQRIDMLMVGSLIGLAGVSVYSIGYFIGVLVSLPFRGIGRIAGSVVADAWKDNDLGKIQRLYTRTSLIQTILGCILLIGIYYNLDNLYYFIPENYRDGKWVVVIIGFGYLVDMVTGLNTYIIATCPKYRYDLLFNLIFLGLTIVLNYVFIPLYGLNGAAIGSAMAFVVFNLLKWGFLWWEYGLQPVNVRFLYVGGIAAVTVLVGQLLPSIPYVILDSVFKSLILGGGYMLLILGLKISPDLNDMAGDVWKRIGRGA